MVRRLFGSIGIAALALALAVAGVGAAEAPDANRPLLSDLMILTQLRQIKLWYAERAGNWRLAAYELDQMKRTLDRIVTLYPRADSVAQDAFVRDKADPALAALELAIAGKDAAAFGVAYGRSTDLCNQCHEQAGVGFITVRVPTKSPFANQLFEPQP